MVLLQLSPRVPSAWRNTTTLRWGFCIFSAASREREHSRLDLPARSGLVCVRSGSVQTPAGREWWWPSSRLPAARHRPAGCCRPLPAAPCSCRAHRPRTLQQWKGHRTWLAALLVWNGELSIAANTRTRKHPEKVSAGRDTDLVLSEPSGPTFRWRAPSTWTS